MSAQEDHIPVMLREVLAALSPKENGVYVDATFGAGGYSRAILESSNCTVYGFDRDPNAIADAADLVERFKGRLFVKNRPFSEMREALAEDGVENIDGVVFDLGVSSMQLDQPERGFSFRDNGRLSMRMDCGSPDAADVIAAGDVKELAAVFKAYGEEKKANAIARAIVSSRDEAPISTTTALADIVSAASPKFPMQKIHPATRVFQALRIFVNDELGELVRGLRAAEQLLRPAGRLVVVAFHSLEDRIVKRFLANRMNARQGGSRHMPEKDQIVPSFEPVYTKPLSPDDDEIVKNARARSAKLRAAGRLPAPPLVFADEDIGLPSFEIVDAFKRKLAL
ncbi:MAG: 16S rRNA (cytosine(1402)-N(4))-methyltransferase RsmH [Marinicaulis sp.]|nr:16S rRNA (cytosine(1402)-N(4))-methyltransferase RsmH [Marinicaulis sp.]